MSETPKEEQRRITVKAKELTAKELESISGGLRTSQGAATQFTVFNLRKVELVSQLGSPFQIKK